MKKQFTEQELYERQEQLESLMFGNGIERFNVNNKRAIEQGEASSTAWFRRLTRAFIEPYAESITAYLEYYTGRAGKPSRSLAYLKMLPAEVAAYVSLKVIFDALPVDGLSLQNIAEKIGRKIEDQVRFTKLEGCAPKYVEAIKEGLRHSKTQSYEHKRTVMAQAESRLASGKNFAYLNDVKSWQDWPKREVVMLGTTLIQIFVDNVQYKDKPVVDIVQHESLRVSATKSSLYFLEPTDAINEFIEEYKEVVSQLSPCYAPCVVPPRNWISATAGGYHTLEVASKLNMVKVNNRKHLSSLSVQQMPEVYKAINSLQSIGWTVAEDVLAVADEVLSKGLGLGMPQSEPLRVRPAPVPVEYQHLRGKELKEALTAAQWDLFCDWKAEAAEIYDIERERRAKYLEAARTVAQANSYAEYENIYFVYTADFRGRLYAQSSLLSPQGGDLQKGLMRFAEGVQLGDSGRYWLAVHGANVWGEDKCSFDDRVAFIERMKEDIKDFATNPLLFKGWAGADKPYQFLNFCLEWVKLLEWEEAGKPASEFVSYVPVAMDGSCSGIQHYSALLRDPVGGAAVNLVPSDKPQDIYAEVAKVAAKSLQGMVEDEEVEPEVKELARAWLLIGVTRGLTKKSVMTLPYGSTRMTCLGSVTEYLSDLVKKEAALAKAEGRKPEAVHPFSNDKKDPMNRLAAERLMSAVIWDSIGKVVVAARAGMSFIKKVTKAVALKNRPLEWVTPTGFIVEQAIYEAEHNRVKTQLMGRTIFTLVEPTDKIDVTKMQSSCAPNYIHSMDASHLVKSACGYTDAGFTGIAVIHDSLGTHAGRTAELREITLKKFVEMYSANNWLEEFKTYNEDLILSEIEVPVPEYLGLDLSVVLKSDYCFA